MNKIEMKCLKEVKKMTSESNMANVHIGHSIDSALKNLKDYSLLESENSTNEMKEKILSLLLKDLQEIKKQNDKAKDTSKSSSEWLDALDNQE